MSLPPVDWVGDRDWEEDAGLTLEVPWEDGQRASLPALLATLGQILARPRRFFAGLPQSGGLAEPLGFVLLVGSTGLLSLLLWQAVLEGMVTGPLPEGLVADYLTSLQDNPRLVFALVLMTPLCVALSQSIFSIFLCGALRLVGPGATSFAAVFRVVAYAQAPAVMCLLPWIGGLVARLWHLWLLVCGLSQTLRLSTGKALLSLFVAALLLFLALFLLIMLLGLVGLWRLLGSS
ncbi:MAG: YIP1 family protein [Desulfobacca sp.]|uniref:YIP1 family protein n=1 Tax=Desulfobacca sp. TaxID=2067990 RepID=UPI00404B6FF2